VNSAPLFELSPFKGVLGSMSGLKHRKNDLKIVIVTPFLPTPFLNKFLRGQSGSLGASENPRPQTPRNKADRVTNRDPCGRDIQQTVCKIDSNSILLRLEFDSNSTLIRF